MRYFPLSEYEGRWSRIEAEMIRRGYDVAVVFGKNAANFERAADVVYLTNYMSTKVGQPYDTQAHQARAYCAVILQRGKAPQLIADDPGYLAVELAVTDVSWALNPVTSVASALKDRGISGPVAFVGSDFFAIKYHKSLLEQTRDIEWIVEDDLVLSVRRRKSPRELECCREAGDISASALQKMMDALVAGKRETDAAALAAHEIVRRGGIVHRINCTSGDNINRSCATAMAGYSDRRAPVGAMVKGWLIGPMFQGYYMDPGRTAVVGGRASESQRHAIEYCAGMVDKLADMVRPGVRYSAVADLGDRLKAEFGGSADPSDHKRPFFGHPNGLYFEGPPYVSNTFGHDDQMFCEGDVIGLEAFVKTSASLGAGFEQNYIVHKEGMELITPTQLFWH